MRGVVRCSKCTAENREGRKFCAECGTPLALRCSRCGASNEAGEKFCGECGAALLSAPAASIAPAIRVSAEHSAGEALEGERKTVTALFADIKGSMELMEDLDPEEARAIVDPALKLMIDAVRRYDGYIVQSTGDGIFALFGAPVAHEDHPQRALYAALRMQDEMRRYSTKLREAGNPPLEARVGINTGETVVRSIQTGDAHTEYTPIGHSTSLASRMQTLAPTGSIAVTETTQKLCAGYFNFKALGPTRVKGVSEPVNVFEVTGLGPLRTRLQRSAGRGLTKFVGRSREMDAMKHAAEQARAGHGQIVAAMAEAGAGKSRLLFEFKATAQPDWMVLETFSVSHGKASAYLPVIELLCNYFNIREEDDDRTRREKVAGRLAILDPALEDTRPYIFSLLGISANFDLHQQWEHNLDRLDEYLRQIQKTNVRDPIDPQVQRRRTLEAIKRVLLRESLNHPVMVIFEDLHWIDDETQAFLNLLADSIGTARILLLVNYRPEYRHGWSNKTCYTQLRLDPLGVASAEEMLSALLGANPELDPFKRLVIERTEGNPFFMEEMVQVLLDEGALVRDGSSARLSRPLGELKIPPTVQAILAARIDRLPSDAKDLLQTLAVIGREFPLALVRAVVPASEDNLNRMLNDLQLGEFIFEQPAVGDTEYAFKHALTQEVAYSSVLMERRRQLHERTGAAIETLYAGSLDDHLAELAHHYGRSTNIEQAVQYLRRAGQQARERFAYNEAQAQLQRGVQLLRTLPESAAHEATELDLLTELSVVLLITKGFAAPETIEVSARAADLAEKSGNLGQIVLQLHLSRVGAMTAGEHNKAAAIAGRMLEVAQREGGVVSFAYAHHGGFPSHFYLGELPEAEAEFTRWTKFHDAGAYSKTAATAVVGAFGAASLCAWTAGYPDQARERITRALEAARDGNSPYDLVLARFFEHLLYRSAREPRHSEIAATQMASLAEEHDIPGFKVQAPVAIGWVRAHSGHPAEAVAQIREGLAALMESGVRFGITDSYVCLAEAQTLSGAPDDALATIAEALEINPEELVYRPNILTYRGSLHLMVGKPDVAEADFREAIALARKMSAKSWELRAAISLARLLMTQGHRDEARAMLAAIYGWFTEGFDTADLIDAKALLEELNN